MRHLDRVLRHRHGHDHDDGTSTAPVHVDGEQAGSHHVHPHPHAHSSEPSDPEAHRDALARGAGAGMVLYLDAFSGLAGDMCIAALVDLGVPFDVVREQVAHLKLSGVELRLRALPAGAIGASKFDVLVSGHQPQRSYAQVRHLLDESALDPGVKRLAQAIFARLAKAESTVHRVALDTVHFHEVGAADALVDIVGAAACFQYLGARVLCSALPMGRGRVRCQHGWLPIPAPATLLCLDGLWTCDADVEAELVTPTGAAIVGEVATSSGWPAMVPKRVGWGRGTRDLPDRTNALRAVLGQPNPEFAAGHSDGRHAVVEANLDDATGEILGHAIARLIEGGALDAWAVPATMKKGRPGWVLSALTTRENRSREAEVMLRETPTIGVRWRDVTRVELTRDVQEVNTPWGIVRVKYSGQNGEILHAKPEFDDCQRLACEHGVSVLVVVEAARLAIGTTRAASQKEG